MPNRPAQSQQLRESQTALQSLRRELDRWAPSNADRSDLGQTGWRRLIGGVRPRRLLDFLAGAPGAGCGLVGLSLCVEACRDRGELVVIDPDGSFFPPTAMAWGVDASRLLLVTPTTAADALASCEVALRSPAVGAVWASLGSIEGRSFRRLLLATEAGEAFGVLVRPSEHLSEPSWANTQLRFDPLAGSGAEDASFLIRATQTRNRHGPLGGKAILSIDWRNGNVQEVTADHDAESPPTNARCLAARLAGATRSA